MVSEKTVGAPLVEQSAASAASASDKRDRVSFQELLQYPIFSVCTVDRWEYEVLRMENCEKREFIQWSCAEFEIEIGGSVGVELTWSEEKVDTIRIYIEDCSINL
jgi:hypothetical protein